VARLPVITCFWPTARIIVAQQRRSAMKQQRRLPRSLTGNNFRQRSDSSFWPSPRLLVREKPAPFCIRNARPDEPKASFRFCRVCPDGPGEQFCSTTPSRIGRSNNFDSAESARVIRADDLLSATFGRTVRGHSFVPATCARMNRRNVLLSTTCVRMIRADDFISATRLRSGATRSPIKTLWKRVPARGLPLTPAGRRGLRILRGARR
jgi:hypothetical protein